MNFKRRKIYHMKRHPAWHQEVLVNAPLPWFSPGCVRASKTKYLTREEANNGMIKTPNY
jgi:hypothetical protein